MRRKERLAVACLAVVIAAALAGCQRTTTRSGGSAQPASTRPGTAPSSSSGGKATAPGSSRTTGGQASAATGPHWTFRHMTLPLRPDWLARGSAETVTVTTSQRCHRDTGGLDCPGFLLLGPFSIAVAHEGDPYDTERPWHPGTGLQGCPGNRDHLFEHDPARLEKGGFAKVRTHTAVYRQWRVPCADASTATDKTTYVQRLWYLPKSRILIVDEWSVPGLAATLAAATWTR